MTPNQIDVLRGQRVELEGEVAKLRGSIAELRRVNLLLLGALRDACSAVAGYRAEVGAGPALPSDCCGELVYRPADGAAPYCVGCGKEMDR